MQNVNIIKNKIKRKMNLNKTPDFKELAVKAVIMFLILLCLLCFGAMNSCKSLPQTQTTTFEKDSIHTSVNFVKRDTTIVVPGDTLELKVPIYSLTENPVTLTTSNGMTLSLSKINDEILAKCNTEDLRKIIELQDKIIKEHKSKIEIKEVRTPEKYVPKFTQIMSYIGMIATGVILVFFGWKLGRYLV